MRPSDILDSSSRDLRGRGVDSVGQLARPLLFPNLHARNHLFIQQGLHCRARFLVILLHGRFEGCQLFVGERERVRLRIASCIAALRASSRGVRGIESGCVGKCGRLPPLFFFSWSGPCSMAVEGKDEEAWCELECLRERWLAGPNHNRSRSTSYHPRSPLFVGKIILEVALVLLAQAHSSGCDVSLFACLFAAGEEC